MPEHPHPQAPAKGEVEPRVFRILVLVPLCALALVAALVLLLVPLLPEHIAMHVGPDGVGYGSTPLMLAITSAAAALALAIGSITGLGFFKAEHWYQTEKLISVGILSLGYGVLGIALATMASTLGVEQSAVSGNSVGTSMLAFVLGFIAALWFHIVALPAGKMEQLGSQ